MCQLTVPALRVFPKGTSIAPRERLLALGYQEREAVGADDSSHSGPPPLESTDEFLARLQVKCTAPAVAGAERVPR